MPLTDYQWELINGPTTLTMGKDTSIDVLRVLGLFDMEVLDGDRSWTRNHGDLPGEHLLRPKQIFMDVEVLGDPTLQAYWDSVYLAQKAFTTRQFPQDTDMLKFKVPGLAERFIRVRPFRRAFPRDGQSEFGAAKFEVTLKAADPRIYEPVGAMNSSGAQGGTFDVTNDGSANAYPKLTFSSGTTVLTNNTYGAVLELAGAAGGTIVDMDRWIRGVNELSVYQGVTSQYEFWVQPRAPMILGSGLNSFTVSSGTVTIEWYDTYI